MNGKWVKKRHILIFVILSIVVAPIIKFIFRFKSKKNKLDKNQGYFIISNHQTLLDPVFLSLSFNKPIYYIATDTLLSNKITSSLIKYAFAPIPKRKGELDISCIKTSLTVAKEKGSICLFVEGNRAYADFQFYISPAIVKFIRKANLPIVLYNFKGGYGINPRWGGKRRKGKFEGNINKIISLEEINEMSDEVLYERIKKGIRVIDSELNENFKSKRKAEYLERLLFVCPKCGHKETLYSKGNFIYCQECDFKAEYLENLHIRTNDINHNYDKLVQWYQFQLDYIKNYQITDEIIFTDKNVKIYTMETGKPKKLITKGNLYFTKDYLKINDKKINISEITSVSPIGGIKLLINTNDNCYFIKGHKRFNPVKFCLFLNILEGPIKKGKGDKCYDLNIYNL